jgi:hypothetical protein
MHSARQHGADPEGNKAGEGNGKDGTMNRVFCFEKEY